MNYGRPHKPCCPQHNTCQACGEPSPCREVLLAENAAYAARLARAVTDNARIRRQRDLLATNARRQRDRIAALSGTEGSTR